MRRKLPPAEAVRKPDLADFNQVRDQMLPQLAAIPLPNTNAQIAAK
jgi:hypothetical protein